MLLWSPAAAQAWQNLARELTSSLRSRLEALPSDIGVTHSVVEGDLARALDHAMARETFDLLVLAPSATRKCASRRMIRGTRVATRVAAALKESDADDAFARALASVS
jgi:hypothetical protein